MMLENLSSVWFAAYTILSRALRRKDIEISSSVCKASLQPEDSEDCGGSNLINLLATMVVLDAVRHTSGEASSGGRGIRGRVVSR